MLNCSFMLQLMYHLEKHVAILNRGMQALAKVWLSKLREPVPPTHEALNFLLQSKETVDLKSSRLHFSE